MKKLLIGLMLMVAWAVHGAGALGTLQYRTNDYTLSPSNTMASNIYAGYGLTKLQGPGGAITLSNIWTTNGLAGTNWVLEQIASLGTHIFASGVTNTSTLWDGAEFRTNQWYGSNGAVLTITTNIVGVVAVNQYIRHIVSAQTFNRIGDGPIDVRAYIAKTAGAGTTQIHPEVYILFGTNLVELGSSVAQTISGATPVAYNWTITVGATNLASPCSVVWAWKVDSVGTASPQLEFVSGGIYDACLTLVENIASAQLDGSQIVSGTVDNSRLPANVLTNERSILTTFNGGVTVTNAAAANGVQMTVGSTAYGVGSVVFSNSAGRMLMGVGTAAPVKPLHVVGNTLQSLRLENTTYAGTFADFGAGAGYMSVKPSSSAYGMLVYNDDTAIDYAVITAFGDRITIGYNAVEGLTLASNGGKFGGPFSLTTSNTTDIPLTVVTNGNVAVQVDAAGVATFNGSAVFRSNAVAGVNPVPNLAATNIGNVGVSGGLRVGGAINAGNINGAIITAGSSLVSQGDVAAAATYLFYWTGRSYMRSTDNGIIAVMSSGQNDFTRYIFGTNAVTGTNFAALSIVNSTNNTAVPAIKVTAQNGAGACDLGVLGGATAASMNATNGYSVAAQPGIAATIDVLVAGAAATTNRLVFVGGILVSNIVGIGAP